MAVDFTGSATYSVSSTIEIAHSYHFAKHCFRPENLEIAESYRTWKRCLVIIDTYVNELYGAQIKNYFQAHGIAATILPAHITEDGKSVEALLQVCTWINDFDILRREPVLVVGGGLVTDVVG